MDRVELPLEVWVLRGSVEGGPVGPRKESNGAGRLIPVSETEQPVCSYFHTHVVRNTDKAQSWIWPIPSTQQLTKSGFKIAGKIKKKKKNHNKRKGSVCF